MSNNQYAIALFQIAKEDNSLEASKELFDTLMELRKINPEFNLVLNSPNIQVKDKKELISKAFKGCYENFIFFIYVILDNGREGLFDEIYASFIALYNEEKKIKIVDVVSCETLTDVEKKDLLASLQNYYAGYQIVINNKIDSKMIGGYQILCDGKSIDLSLKNKVTAMKSRI